MATYRSLFLGCGARAQWHAPAYRELRNMELAGVCDLDAERREAFCQKYGVPAAYDDYETALSDLRPDIVHVITCPGRRVWEIETAARAGVRTVIVEKPLAIKPSEIEELSRIRAQYDMEIITNCQRRYYPQFRDGTIRDIVQNRIGDLYFVRASTRGNTMGMGPHTMDLLLFFLGEVEPEAVWAMAHTINEEGYQATHLAPESILAEHWFPNNVRVIFDCDPEALGTPRGLLLMHLHFDSWEARAGSTHPKQGLLVSERGNGGAGAWREQLQQTGAGRPARFHPGRRRLAGAWHATPTASSCTSAACAPYSPRRSRSMREEALSPDRAHRCRVERAPRAPPGNIGRITIRLVVVPASRAGACRIAHPCPSPSTAVSHPSGA